MSSTDFTGPLPIITPRHPQKRAGSTDIVRAQQTIIRAQRVLAEFSEEGRRTAEETITLLVEILGEEEHRDDRTMAPLKRRNFDWR